MENHFAKVKCEVKSTSLPVSQVEISQDRRDARANLLKVARPDGEEGFSLDSRSIAVVARAHEGEEVDAVDAISLV